MPRSAGDISIDVNEAISGPDRWELLIDLPRFYLRFAIPAPSTVAHLRGFLACHLNQATTGDLALGTFGDSSVSIIKDDEFGDRFFLSAAARDGVVRHVSTDDDVRDFITALTQAMLDIDDDKTNAFP